MWESPPMQNYTSLKFYELQQRAELAIGQGSVAVAGQPAHFGETVTWRRQKSTLAGSSSVYQD